MLKKTAVLVFALMLLSVALIAIPTFSESSMPVWAAAEPLEGMDELLLSQDLHGNWKILNAQKETVVDNLFEKPVVEDGYAKLVRLDSKNALGRLYGMADASGRLTIPIEYSSLQRSLDSKLVTVERNKLYGFMTLDGETLVEPKYINAKTFINGYVPVAKHDPSKDNMSGEGQLWGIIDSTGRETVPCVYEAIEDFDGQTAWVNEAGRWCAIDMQGELVLETKYSIKAGSFVNGYCVMGERLENTDSSDSGESGVYGVIDRNGREILPLIYDSTGDIREDNTITVRLDGKNETYLLTPEGAEKVAQVTSDLLLDDYMPFTGTKVAKLDGEPTLAKRASAKHPHPRLDGATALFPVYAAFVEAVYPDETRYAEVYNADADKPPVVTCTKTNRAYERLIEGDADIIFCAQPSAAQIKAAADAGVEFELTPFGKEAFVFIVNERNPLNDISVSKIQDVYSGKLTQWSELGIDDLGEIVAYQRPKNSGSQTALEALMGDIPIMEAPTEIIAGFMDTIVENIEYSNLPNALGYSFRFFCTEMMDSGVKLLAIDGVAPTIENIRNDSYPITSTLYAVTRKGDTNPNVRALLDWVISPQGQELVEKSGYVGI